MKHIIAMLVIAALLAACATTTSSTGRRQYVGAVSQAELNQLGAQAFTDALQHYRRVRAQVLELARQENFDEIRRLVPAQVRPAYDRVKETLEALTGQRSLAVAATVAPPAGATPSPAPPASSSSPLSPTPALRLGRG